MTGRWIGALLALAGLTATPLLAQSNRSLAGRWTVTLEVDPRPTTESVPVALTGTLVIVALPGVEPPTFRGSYRIPFSTARLGPDAAPLLARTRRDDSVRVVLDPAGDGGTVELVGAWRLGGVAGRWRSTRREPALAGRFVMKLDPR